MVCNGVDAVVFVRFVQAGHILELTIFLHWKFQKFSRGNITGLPLREGQSPPVPTSSTAYTAVRTEIQSPFNNFAKFTPLQPVYVPLPNATSCLCLVQLSQFHTAETVNRSQISDGQISRNLK